MLSLMKNVAYNVVKEKTTYGLLKALSNLYEKPSSSNKVFLIRQLVIMKTKEGASIKGHVNEFNSILSRLILVDIKFNDEVQALLLLFSLLESWSCTVTTVNGSTILILITLEKNMEAEASEVPSDGINATIDGRGNVALWHQRLRHISEKGMKILASKGRISVLQKTVVGFVSHVYWRNRRWKVKDVARDKLDAKSAKCTFIGYGSDEIGYRFWISKSHKVVRSRDITFDEDSLYGAKAETDSSNLTKPSQKDQVVRAQIRVRGPKTMGASRIVEDQIRKTLKTEHPSRREAPRLHSYKDPPESLGLWLVLSIVAVENLHLEQLDVKTTFLHGEIDEDIYMTPPEACSEMAEIKKLKRQLSQEFEMKDLDLTKKVLEKFNMKDAKARCQPLGDHFKVGKKQAPKTEASTQRIAKVPYVLAVGSMMEHWEAVKWLLRYLKCTSKATLCFSRNEVVLEGFSNSDYGGSLDSGKSTTGYVFIVGGIVVSWMSKIQKCVAMSTIEAEYIAIAEAGKELNDIFSMVKGPDWASNNLLLVLTGDMSPGNVAGISLLTKSRAEFIEVMVIDKGWTSLGKHEKAFYTGLKKFVDDCKLLVDSAGTIRCPCKSCCLVLWVSIKCLSDHISNYIPLNNKQNEPTQGDFGKTSNDPTQTKRNEFEELYASANEELYPSCDYVTRLDFMAKFTYFKAKGKLTDSIFNGMLEFFQNVFPTAKGYKLPSSYYAMKKTFKTIRLGYESIHACLNGVRFVVHSPDEHCTTQNSGICSPDVDAPPDIIDVVDEDDDIIDEEDPIPHDLADSDDEDLANLGIDDGVNMSADVARGHGGDGGGDDRPPPYQVPIGCGGCLGNRGKGTRKPNLGNRRAGRLHTRQETQNLGLKAITDKSGPVLI
nr:hypothetical protein [Tanacetum cinerariifolium]